MKKFFLIPGINNKPMPSNIMVAGSETLTAAVTCTDVPLAMLLSSNDIMIYCDRYLSIVYHWNEEKN